MAKRKNDPNFFIHPTSSQGPLDSGLTYDIWSFQAGVTQHSVKPPTQVISIILRTRNSECVNWAILAARLGTNYISWHLVEINVVVACKMQMESGRKWSGCSPLDASYCCNEHTAKAALDNSLSVLLSLFPAIFPSWFLSDPSGTDLSLVFSTSSSRPVSDYYYKCLLYHIQAWGSPQPIHFLKAHDISSPNTDENTNTKTKTVTKTMTKTKTPREWLKQ